MFLKRQQRRGALVANLIIGLVLITAILLVGGYAAGWIHFSSNADKATIEFETREIQDATNNAAKNLNKELQELGEQTGKTLKDAGESLEKSSDDSTISTTPSTSESTETPN